MSDVLTTGASCTPPNPLSHLWYALRIHEGVMFYLVRKVLKKFALRLPLSLVLFDRRSDSSGKNKRHIKRLFGATVFGVQLILWFVEIVCRARDTAL